MNTLAPALPITLPARSASKDPYASPAQVAAVLRPGANFRRDRLQATDMLSTEQAAELTGTTRVTINTWIKNGRCLGLVHLRRGFRLPKWQFEPWIFPLIQPLIQALGAADGWQLLAFLESPQQALDGQTPRTALEQGTPPQRILALATAAGH